MKYIIRILPRSAWPIVHKNPAQHAGTESAGPEQNLEVEMFDHRGPGWILFDSQGNINIWECRCIF